MNSAPIIEIWDGLLFQSYNYFNQFCYLFCNYKKKILKKNAALKDKYRGKRCFIIMNGPSINKYDLSPLANEVVFCSNYFYKSDLAKIVKPNYYCWTDSKIFRYPDVINTFDSIRKECPGVTLLLNMKGAQVLGVSNDIFYEYCKHMPNLFSVKCEMTRIVSNFSTVAFMAINSAIYMGFSKIYVMGLDFEPGAFKHFTDLGVECSDPNKKKDKQDVCGNYWNYTKAHYESYYLNKKAADKGCRIINLNPDSRIRAFEFAVFEEII